MDQNSKIFGAPLDAPAILQQLRFGLSANRLSALSKRDEITDVDVASCQENAAVDSAGALQDGAEIDFAALEEPLNLQTPLRCACAKAGI